MSRLEKIFQAVRVNPVRIIEYSLAFCLISYGAFVFLPDYSPAQSSTMGQYLTSWPLRAGIATAYILSALFTLYGLIRNKHFLLIKGGFVMFIAFLYTTLFRLLSTGFAAGTWFFPLALAVICCIIYLHRMASEN